ncbi:MAG: ATP-binding protein [Clostridia bacterium]|nr:ATP-binding protein [Clostridia bacterium]
MPQLINRPEYLSQLIQHKDVDLVKIITGVRRCGKSSLMELYHQYLLDSGIDEDHIIHMNLESLKYRDLGDFLALYDYVSSRIAPFGRTYLMFDEIQAVEHWEKAVESFRLDYDVDICLTGSNAYMLSTDFSTLLSGRYVEVPMLPLSFQEFLTFHDFDPSESLEEKFRKYMRFGGMPVLREYHFNEQRSYQALEGIYSTVVLRDVLQRNHVIDQNALRKIVLFLCSSIGTVTSPNRIGNVLSSEGELSESGKNAVAGRTVGKYIEMLNNAFVFYPVERYDVKGKQLLRTLNKNYIVDLGIRNMLLGYRDADTGHILENIVFLELKRRDWHVYIGKIGNLEIDFVAEKPGTRMYIQVTESMLTEETRDRELRSLRAVRDNYEKIVLTMDRNFSSSYDGIKIINVIDWLLQKI